MKEEITTLKPEEFEDMMRFLERCYRHSRDFFPRRYPHVWRKDTIQYENRIILKVDGKIVSHVGIFPLTLIVGRARISAGGIGGVATLQEYRGKGYMSKLMNYSIEKMRKDGYSISILWGDRQRYGHFCYETVGRLATFTLSLRSLKQECETTLVDFRRYYGERKLLKKIVRMHENEMLKVKRSMRDYELIFNIPHLMTFMSDNAYVCYMHRHSPLTLIEYGGKPLDVVSLIYSLLNAFNREFGISSVKVKAPYYPYETFLMLRKVCSHWSIEPEGMVKILDLKKLFEEYSPYLEEISEDIKLEFSLEVKEKHEKVAITLDRGSVITKPGARSNLHVALHERDMVKLLFDGVEEVGLAEKYSKLRTVFPLPFHVWLLDHI